ncbi:MAG: protein kinase [Acidobacteriota bacterium]
MADRKRTDFRLDHLREKLGDLYDFEALLGRGAFAAVYLVRNLRLDRYEALKVLSEAYDEDEAFVNRFIHEAKLVASLDHPNIVKVYDYGEVDGIVWFSMQYVDGPTLRSELNAQGRLSPASVVGLCIPLLDALDYSHARGTIHRDIKPSNVLLDTRGNPFLMDFGIAKSSSRALKTLTGRILGTPAYISPEQVQGQAVDGRADIYSVGAAMYEMLTGSPPFEGEDALQVIVQRIHEDPRPISSQQPGIDEELETIVMRALEREVDDRYATAGTMRQALIDYLAEEGNPDGFVLRATAPKLVQLEEQPTTTDLDLRRKIASAEKTKVMASAETEPSRRPWLVAAVMAVAVSTLALVAVPRWLAPSSPDSTRATVPIAADPSKAALSPATPSTAEPSSSTAGPEPSEPQEASAGESERASLQAEAGDDDSAAADAATAQTFGAVPGESQERPSSPVLSPKAPQASPPPPPRMAPPPPIRRAVVVPKIRHQPQPRLSPALAERCAGETAIVSLQVDASGAVTRARVLSSALDDCGKEAGRLAQEYLFDPAEDAEGQPMAATATINITFDEATE